MSNYWHFLENFCKARDLPLFALRWESKDSTQIEVSFKKSAEKSGIFELAKTTTSWS